MSYASRLIEMSRGHVPSAPARLLAVDDQLPREEIIETEVPRPAPPSPLSVPDETRHVIPPTESKHATKTAPRSVPDASARREPSVVREMIERHTIVEAPPQLTPAIPPEPLPMARLPPLAQWLAEPSAAPEPLVESADTDALRELMRSVRQWTASAPTVIEHETVPSATASTPVIAKPPEPTHVSIGNVTITVEDAPPTSAKRAPAPARVTSDRMARNHIRGG